MNAGISFETISDKKAVLGKFCFIDFWICEGVNHDEF